MMPVILNILNVILIIGAVLFAVFKTEEKRIVFRYFTVLSNLLCALTSLIAAVSHASGKISGLASVLKYIGTSAVTVTLLTVVLFLGPAIGSIKELLKGRDLFLHLICPVIAILTYILWDRTDMRFSIVFSGTVPVLLYGVLYLYKVIYAPKDRRWDDFYMFNRNGKWPISFAAMYAGSFIVSLILWII